MFCYASSAGERGIQVIIVGVGGAAHLPGMVAALTPLHVIGVPVRASALDGLDSLLSIVQGSAGETKLEKEKVGDKESESSVIKEDVSEAEALPVIIDLL
ncbi:unnamed protein product [Lactuca virosa]|uniref:phosphoribosylaminoimidazole carboxylase n=1 Tax=Lactuca virosa TaxID=75947 RepID=A0AAU9MCC9_9ASTR|nr:unnamed protein product [Lactuca virosa]